MSNRTLDRVKRELQLLSNDLPAATQLQLGQLTVNNTKYIGLIARGLPVNPACFGNHKSVSMLVLIPPQYPTLPPLGVYVDRPYQIKSGHFVERGYHGAPSLEQSGWRWFCSSFGGFSDRSRGNAWRPSDDIVSGHNLATVLVGARVMLELGA